eukprot:6899824-Prorocentrum_lima.AAC.1
MTSSLVGSEMCIRDRPLCSQALPPVGFVPARLDEDPPLSLQAGASALFCLLYTSDAADDM